MSFIRKLLTPSLNELKPLAKTAALPVVATNNRLNSKTIQLCLSSETIQLYFDCIKTKSKGHPDCQALKEELDNQMRCTVGTCP